jgi:hypothetical protein
MRKILAHLPTSCLLLVLVAGCGSTTWNDDPGAESAGHDDAGEAGLPGTPANTATGNGASASCVPPQSADGHTQIQGSFRVLSLTVAGPEAGKTPCGEPYMNVRVEFLPNGVRCPSGPVVVDELDFAGTPLSKPCSDRIGLQVGGVYSNASLVNRSGRPYVEDDTESAADLAFCSDLSHCSSDAGDQ